MAKKLEKVDVIIVGSGWAGGITAAELSKKGYQVVGLERGGDQKTEDFIGSKDELRYDRRYELYSDLTKETLTIRNTMDEEAQPIRSNETNAIIGTHTGGTGVHWEGMTYRWLPTDFEIYSKTIDKYGEDIIPKDMILQDWGITYDELEPYYDQFEKTTGISGEEDPLRPKRSMEYPNPPTKNTPQINLFKKAAKDLGYHPYHMPSANADQKYENPDGENLNACVYCAFCVSYGCGFGAKPDPITTVLATAKNTGNYELRNHAYVKRVLHDDGHASGVVYLDTETGIEYEQPADVVVLSGFVFSNVRLLLLSEIGEAYDPIKQTGVIGSHFSGHYPNITFGAATGFFNDKKFNSFAGAGALGAVLDDFNVEQLDHNKLDFLHGFHLAINQPGNTPINNNAVPNGTPLWGEEFKEKSLFYTNRNLTILIQEGVLPFRYNYMDLDPNFKDFLGDPILRITCKLHDQERNIIRYGREKAVELLEEMGADIIDSPEITEETEFNQTSVNSHCGGGAIMGANPKNSAVNNYSQMWEMENLFVVGASAYPNFSSSNPTGTLGALAYRAAEGIDKYLKNDGGLLVEAKSKTKNV